VQQILPFDPSPSQLPIESSSVPNTVLGQSFSADFSWNDFLPTDHLSQAYLGEDLSLGLGPDVYESSLFGFNPYEDFVLPESAASLSPNQHLTNQVLLCDETQQISDYTARSSTSELSSVSSLASSLPDTPIDTLSSPSPFTSALELWVPSRPETAGTKRKVIEDDDDDENVSVSDDEQSVDSDFHDDSSDEEEHTMHPPRSTKRTRAPPAKRRRTCTAEPESSSSSSSSSPAPTGSSRRFVCEQLCTTCDRRESKGQARKTFTRSSDRLRHYRSTARARTFDCPVCGLQLSRKDALHRHKSTCPGA
jgi:hypothetical protein